MQTRSWLDSIFCFVLFLFFVLFCFVFCFLNYCYTAFCPNTKKNEQGWKTHKTHSHEQNPKTRMYAHTRAYTHTHRFMCKVLMDARILRKRIENGIPEPYWNTDWNILYSLNTISLGNFDSTFCKHRKMFGKKSIIKTLISLYLSLSLYIYMYI